MEILTLPVGPLQVNCYLVWERAGNSALIIDPGDDAAVVLATVREHDLRPAGVLLTHAHVDHIRGVSGVVEELGTPVMLHAADEALYFSPDNALPPWVPAATNLPRPSVVANDLDGLAFAVIHTPGHTPGGVCYHFRDESVLFSGDTLFESSIGRTDLPGGDMPSLLSSIRQRLLPLSGDTRVYPGHGPPTTIGREARSNPFLDDEQSRF